MNQSQKTSSRIRRLLAKEVTTPESPDPTQLLIRHDQRKKVIREEDRRSSETCSKTMENPQTPGAGPRAPRPATFSGRNPERSWSRRNRAEGGGDKSRPRESKREEETKRGEEETKAEVERRPGVEVEVEVEEAALVPVFHLHSSLQTSSISCDPSSVLLPSITGLAPPPVHAAQRGALQKHLIYQY